jgi:hypothetical protein
MDVLILLVFVSLVLVAGALVLFLSRIHGGDFDHSDRLSLLPLEPDGESPGGESEGPSRGGGDSL